MAPTVRGLPSHPLSQTPSSRVEVDAFAVGERPQIEALTSAPAQIAAPGVAVGVGPAVSTSGSSLAQKAPACCSTGLGSTCTGPSRRSISMFQRLSQAFSGRRPGWQANSRAKRPDESGDESGGRDAAGNGGSFPPTHGRGLSGGSARRSRPTRRDQRATSARRTSPPDRVRRDCRERRW